MESSRLAFLLLNSDSSPIIPTTSFLTRLPAPTGTIVPTSTFPAVSLIRQLSSTAPTAAIRRQRPPYIFCPSPASGDSYPILHPRKETPSRVVSRPASFCRFRWQSKEFAAGHDTGEAAAEFQSILTNARRSTISGSLYRCWSDYTGRCWDLQWWQLSNQS